jgi:uncharacterized protein YbjT (DUF2867 family)
MTRNSSLDTTGAHAVLHEVAHREPVLITGAGGGTGGVGHRVVELLRERGLPVRAMVHREDERAQGLRDIGAQVVVGDLTQPSDVAAALDGCRRMFFVMSVSPAYLEAAVTLATVARELGGLEALVGLSQMTVSQMTAVSSLESKQHRLQWQAEQVLDWSALPVVRVRPTVFLENPLFTSLIARSVAEKGVIRLPFGHGRTSPVAADDVARSVAAVLQDPEPHIGRVHELTGPRSQDMSGVAEEYSRALGKRVTYVDVPFDAWADHVRVADGMSPHLRAHLTTMARLHRRNYYDRATATVASLTGRPAQTVESFVAGHAEMFTARADPAGR